MSPITAPERKATCSPWFSDLRAPSVVRLLARVAVFMPNQPARPEKKPPVRNAKGTHRDWTLRTKARKARKSAAKMKNMVTVISSKI